MVKNFLLFLKKIVAISGAQGAPAAPDSETQFIFPKKIIIIKKKKC